MGESLKYQVITRYKYRSTERTEFMTQAKPPREIVGAQGYIRLQPTGLIKLGKGYAWSGASGPAIDTKNILAPSMVHDALYQLISEGELDLEFRDAADQTLRQMCLERGMWRVRAWWIYHAVRLFGRTPALQRSEPRVMAAP